jgi:predicted TIM-barrel fold metal-dependent hydrolase
MIVDSHMHIWNRLHGMIGGKIPLVAAGHGMIKIGDKRVLGMPSSHTDSTARADWAVAEFDAAGVDAGVVVQENMDGQQNDYCLESMRRFPGRFFCHALPDYFAPETFRQQCDRLFLAGFRGIKVAGGHLEKAGIAIDSPAFMPVWERMADEGGARGEGGSILAVDLSEGEGQVPQMENILRRLPRLRVALGHFGMPNRRGWPGQLRLCRYENVHLESGGIIWLYRHEGYPFPGAIAAIREAARQVGWEKLMWGSDWPRTMVDFTYRQSLNFIRESREISASEKSLFLGENAARLYGLPRPDTQRHPAALITEG